MNMRISCFLVSLACAGGGLSHSYAAEPHKSAEKDADQAVVTVTALRETVLETVQPVSVLGGEDLVRQRALSLGETLISQPGVSATYFGPQASRPVIRGIGGERVQMYEDGTESLDVSGVSNDHSVTIDPLAATSVEIVRGPATLLYGSGASGGLVNVLTHRIPEALSGEPFAAALEFRGDSALEERAAAGAFDGELGSFAWHADLHTRETDDVSIPGFALSRALREEHEAGGEAHHGHRGVLENSASDSWGGSIGGSWIGDRAFAGFSVSTFDTRYGIPGGHEHEDEPAEEEGGVQIDMEQTRYSFKAQLLNPGGSITSARIQATYNDYQHAEVEPSGEIGTLFDQTGVDARVGFEHAPLFGWRGTFGTQYREIDLSVIGEEALLPPSRTQNIGYFVYEERAIGPVTFELGARLEQQRVTPDAPTGLPDYDHHSISGSAGALWKLSDEYTLAFNVTSTERHPTSTELYANGPHIAAQRFEAGDPNLRREHALGFDAGIRKTSGAWQGALTVFRNDYSRYIFASPTELEADGLPVFQYVQGGAVFSGFELELTAPAIDTAAGALVTRFVADYVRAELDDGGDLPQIPPLRVGAELQLVRAQFSGGLTVMWYDDQDRVAANERATDGYTMVDLDLSYRTPVKGSSLLVFLRGSNLLDEEARRHTSPLKDLAPLPGRAVSGGIRLEF